jgi:hypothetical protein
VAWAGHGMLAGLVPLFLVVLDVYLEELALADTLPVCLLLCSERVGGAPMADEVQLACERHVHWPASAWFCVCVCMDGG